MQIGTVKLSIFMGNLNSVQIRMKINNKQLFTSDPVIQNEVFYFAIPPNSIGQTIAFELASLSPIQSGQCLFQVI